MLDTFTTNHNVHHSFVVVFNKFWLNILV